MTARRPYIAIAAVCELARLPATVNQGEIARRLGVPYRHLEPKLQALVRAGIISATRGPSGGYSLARPSNTITFDDILEAVDNDYAGKFDLPVEDAVHLHVRKAMKGITIATATVRYLPLRSVA